MDSLNSSLRRFAVVLIYSLLWLSSFQIKDIIMNPNYSNLERVFFSVFAGFMFAYVNGFEFFKRASKMQGDK